MKTISRILITIIISLLLLILSSLISIYFKDDIYYFMRDSIFHKKDHVKLDKNEYYRDYDFLFVQNTNDFIAKDKKHLINILYTFLNSGDDEFEFYCDKSYDACISDINDIFPNSKVSANVSNVDNTVLHEINYYVHPYNSFKSISVRYNEYGEITLKTEKIYSKEQIDEINKEIKKIEKEILNDTMTDKQKIRAIHDYIINHTKYVDKQNDDDVLKNNTAYSLLFNNESYCEGYSDTMLLFLEDLGIKSYRITSNRHMWNLVFLDNVWYHLDVTWDDPVTPDDSDRLDILFFLITDDRLKQLKVKEHDYDENIYLELKKD